MKTAKQTVNEINKIYDFLTDRYKKSFDESDKNFNYINNNCWDENTKIYLDKLGKPHLTYNFLFSVINTLVGNEQVSRKKIKFKAQTVEDETRAEIVQKRWETLSEEQSVEHKLQDIFQAGMIYNHGGWLQWRVDFDDMFNAEFFVEKVNPFDIMPEHESARYDLSDCSYILKKVWMSIEDIKKRFSDAELKDESRNWWDKLLDYISHNTASINAKYYDKYNDKYLLLELQKKVDRVCNIVEINGKTLSLTDDEINRIKESGEKVNVVAKRSGKRIRKTIVAPYFNEAVLYDADMPYPFPYFDVIPFYTQSFDNDACERKSLISYLTDAQDDINKAKSQHAEIVANLTSRETAVVSYDTKAIEAFENSAGEANAVIPVQSINNYQAINRSAGISPEILNRSVDGVNMIDRISQINSAMRGESERSGETGVLFDSKLNRAAMSINSYYESLSKTRKMLAQVYADLFPFIYFEMNRILNIKDNDNFTDIVINIETGNGIINDMTNFSKNLIVTESDSTITKIEEEFNKEMFISQQLMAAGIMPPMHLLVKNSTLSNKEEFSGWIEEQMNIKSQNEKADQLLNDTGTLIQQEQMLNQNMDAGQPVNK